MILGFKTKFPSDYPYWGRSTYFVGKILTCFFKGTDGFKPKLHTLRHDENNRWKAGRLIHFSTGVRTKKYKCFYKSKCVSIQYVKIDSSQEVVYIMDKKHVKRTLRGNQAKEFALNDGFDDPKDFWAWFKDTKEILKLIHWTDKKY